MGIKEPKEPLDDTKYAKLLEMARSERALTVQARLEMNRRIDQLDAVIAALADLVNSSDVDPARGITHGISNILKTAPKGTLTRPTALRELLEFWGFDFSGQANAMASIHAILKRLERRGHITATADADGVAYQWVSDEGKKPAKEGAK